MPPKPQPGIFEQQRIVAIYGHPHEPITGILGKFDTAQEAADKAKVSADANAEWPIGKTQNETYAFFLKVAQRVRAEHKKAVNLIRP
mgnify:CR=1 FL=1